MLAGHRLPAPLTREVERQWRRGPVAVTTRFGRVARVLAAERVRSASIALPGALPDGAAAPIVLGLARGGHRFDRYRPTGVPSFRITIAAPRRSFELAGRDALAAVEGICLARDLVNTPAEEMGPDEV